MRIAFGIITAAGGLFLFLWYRTVVALPRKKQPNFILSPGFKWGVPAISLGLFASGIILVLALSLRAGLLTVAIAGVLAFLTIRLDRYSAEMRVICYQHREIRRADPGLGEMEILYEIARRRYPAWSHDRLVELVAGKDLKSLVLLIAVNENEINPIADWELYRGLKAKAAEIVKESI